MMTMMDCEALYSHWENFYITYLKKHVFQATWYCWWLKSLLNGSYHFILKLELCTSWLYLSIPQRLSSVLCNKGHSYSTTDHISLVWRTNRSGRLNKVSCVVNIDGGTIWQMALFLHNSWERELMKSWYLFRILNTV